MYQKIRSLAGLVLTLVVIHFIDRSLLVLFVLLCLWFILFRPLNKTEMWLFSVATVFFIAQNYAVLKGGGFAFRQQDFLLMPYYEPCLWGFYFLNIKRFVAEAPGAVGLEARAVLGLVVTALCFSLFSSDSLATLVATTVSTALLFAMFHQRNDLVFSGYALFLGFVVEIFGVTTELWAYPEPDFLGLPFWFVTLWLSVGILGRRFLIPLVETFTERRKSNEYEAV